MGWLIEDIGIAPPAPHRTYPPLLVTQQSKVTVNPLHHSPSSPTARQLVRHLIGGGREVGRR